MAPRDEAMLVHMLRTAIAHDGPAALRYPRGAAEGVELPAEPERDPDRHAASCWPSGERVALLGYGYGVAVALRGGGDPRRPRPRADRRRRPLRQAARRRAGRAARRSSHDLLVTIEENVLPGGFGSAVLEHLEDAFAERPGERARVLRVGLPDRYVTHGKPALLREEVGLTGEAVAERVPRRAALRRARPELRSSPPIEESPQKFRACVKRLNRLACPSLFWGYLREERHLYVCGSAGREPRGSTA